MDSAGGANFRTPVDPSTFASNSLPTQESMYTADEFLTRTKLISIFATSGAEVIISNANDIFSSLLSYISLGEKNPLDSVLVAANLAKAALGRLHNDDVN
ncbi:hypothetical protein ACS0TY_035149 [Phlomoides rotata]